MANLNILVEAVFCDIGPHSGQMKMTGILYLTQEEYSKFVKTGRIEIHA
jgi:hypothetical protein